jgi:hypothetical protein
MRICWLSVLYSLSRPAFFSISTNAPHSCSKSSFDTSSSPKDIFSPFSSSLLLTSSSFIVEKSGILPVFLMPFRLTDAFESCFLTLWFSLTELPSELLATVFCFTPSFSISFVFFSDCLSLRLFFLIPVHQ